MIRTARALTWLATGVLGALALGRPPLARAVATALVATVGIAHGATDDAMLARIGIVPPRGRRLVSLLYGLLALGTFRAARRSPKSASRALFTLAWLHFGAGDAAFARACGSRSHGALAALIRGAPPLCIGGRGARSNAVFAAALCSAAGHALVRAYADALDIALPAVLLYAMPVQSSRLGFTIYFGAWHAPRHLALILARDPRGGTSQQRLARFLLEALPNVALALAFGGVAYVLGGSGSADEDFAGALILAITVPHQLAVWLLERDARRR
jgi:hypothetical protein